MGMHRVWKAYTVAVAQVKPGHRVLDIAGGTGDMAKAFARQAGPEGLVVHTDINETMLRTGRDRLLDEGLALPTTTCDAERLPFRSASFDRVCVAFGLRNMTHKDAALAEMCRVLKPGGRLLVLEFSKVAQPLRRPYDWYSMNVLPLMGKLIAKDASRPGHPEGDDEDRRLRPCRRAQPHRRSRGTSRGHQVLSRSVR
jgi:demethylmenaquinone methyltransferase/2-methoxy-6-polyprenyl-1,4-benzoquinol methylase